MKYRIYARKDHMRVRFVVNAPDLKTAINKARAYLKEQANVDDTDLEQFDVTQIDKEDSKVTLREEGTDPSQQDLPGTKADDAGEGDPRPKLPHAAGK